MLGKIVAQAVVSNVIAAGVGRVVGEVAYQAMPAGIKTGAKVMYTIGAVAIGWYAGEKIGSHAANLAGEVIDAITQPIGGEKKTDDDDIIDVHFEEVGA